MRFRLDGRRALVMGATKGLGRAIAEAFAGAGARVAITGRKADDAQAAAAAIGHGAVGIACDSANLTSIDAAHGAAVTALGGPMEILLLNSGGPPAGSAQGIASEMWQQQFTGMFVGLVRMADLALPAMIAAKFGRILTITSSGVIQPIPNLAMSNALRPALIGWGKTLASEVAGHGITVNSIIPGRIATERLDYLDGANATKQGKPIEQIRTESVARIPAGRYGLPKEFAAAALFLASTEAGFVTGSMLRVDGGQISSV
jgi:3-oxoacyl-[acyl-carrier protein] reductase